MLKKTVALVIDDSPEVQSVYYRFLAREGIGVLQVFNEEEARLLFGSNKNISIVIFDGCLGGHRINTLDIVKEIKGSGFNGLTIAAAADPGDNEKLLAAGCKVGLAKTEPGRWPKFTRIIKEHLAIQAS